MYMYMYVCVGGGRGRGRHRALHPTKPCRASIYQTTVKTQNNNNLLETMSPCLIIVFVNKAFSSTYVIAPPPVVPHRHSQITSIGTLDSDTIDT